MANKKKQQPAEEPQARPWELCSIPVAEIHPSDDNPRGEISEDSVRELAESIKVHGILQPVTIRPDEEHGTEASPWVMVCGHRRLKACQMLGLETIPAIIRDDMSDDEAYDLMIVENLQRKDLDPLDEAVAYKALLDPYPVTGYPGSTVKELAARFGKSEKYIRGRVALNELIPELKELIKTGSLTIGAGISLAELPMEQQREFMDDFTPETSEVDENVVIAPIGITDVKEYLNNNSDEISRQAFSEDPDEKWNTRLHKCAGCPFNSASQGALFADMVEPGNCSNTSCMNDKALAYAQHIFGLYISCAVSGERMIEEKDITFIVEPNPYFGRGAGGDNAQALYDKLKSRLEADGIKPLNTTRYDRIWNYAPGDPTPENSFRALDLSALVAGRREYFKYYKVPAQSNDPTAPKEVTHYDVYNKIINLKEKRQSKIYEQLQPMSKAALESFFAADTALASIPAWLQRYMAYHIINAMSWSARQNLLGIAGVTLSKVTEYLQTHTFTDVVHTAIQDNIDYNSSSFGKYLIESVLSAIAGDSAQAIIDEISEEFQPKIDGLIQQLRTMGYDENNEPLPADEGEAESDDDNDAESNEREE